MHESMREERDQGTRDMDSESHLPTVEHTVRVFASYGTVCLGKTKSLGPKRGNANLENYCAPLNENLMGTA